MSSSNDWGGVVRRSNVVGSGLASAWPIVIVVVCCTAVIFAQTPQPAERVTFDEAIKRAMTRNPSSAIAAADILRADGLLAQARSAARLQVTATATSTTLNRGIEFQGITVTPQ